MTNKITVKPGECIDRGTGTVTQFSALPISPTERVTPDDPRWPEAAKQNCGENDRTFIQQPDGTYAPEAS